MPIKRGPPQPRPQMDAFRGEGEGFFAKGTQTGRPPPFPAVGEFSSQLCVSSPPGCMFPPDGEQKCHRNNTYLMFFLGETVGGTVIQTLTSDSLPHGSHAPDRYLQPALQGGRQPSQAGSCDSAGLLNLQGLHRLYSCRDTEWNRAVIQRNSVFSAGKMKDSRRLSRYGSIAAIQVTDRFVLVCRGASAGGELQYGGSASGRSTETTCAGE